MKKILPRVITIKLLKTKGKETLSVGEKKARYEQRNKNKDDSIFPFRYKINEKTSEQSL